MERTYFKMIFIFIIFTVLFLVPKTVYSTCGGSHCGGDFLGSSGSQPASGAATATANEYGYDYGYSVYDPNAFGSGSGGWDFYGGNFGFTDSGGGKGGFYSSTGYCQVTSGTYCNSASCNQYDQYGSLVATKNDYCINSTTLVQYGCVSSNTCSPTYTNCNNLNPTTKGQDFVCIVDKCVPRNPCGTQYYQTSFNITLGNPWFISGYDYQNKSSFWNNTLSGNISSVCFYATNTTPLFGTNTGIINYTLSASPGSAPFYSGFVNATPINKTCPIIGNYGGNNIYNLNDPSCSGTGWACDYPKDTNGNPIPWPYTSTYLTRYISGSCGGTATACSSLNSAKCSKQQGCSPATICYGTPTPCSSFTNSVGDGCVSNAPSGCHAVCSKEVGCTGCGGTPAACSNYNGNYQNCIGYGCNWQVCQGTATACSQTGYKDYQTCPNQLGCSWKPLEQVAYTNISCLGQANSCGSFTDNNSCSLQQGCSWNPATQCNGTATYSGCNGQNFSNCQSDYRCANYCTGTPYSCSNWNDADVGCTSGAPSGCHKACSQEGGCSCTGTPAACSTWKNNQACSSYGCTLNACSLNSTDCGTWNNTSSTTCNAVTGCNWLDYSCQGTPNQCNTYGNINTCRSQLGCTWQSSANGNSYNEINQPETNVDRWEQLVIQPNYHSYSLNNATQISSYGIAPTSGPNSQVIFFDNSKSTSGTGSNYNFNLTVGNGSNRALFVGISYSSASTTVNSVTYAGQSLSSVVSTKSSSYTSALYVLTNPPSGNNIVNVVLSSPANAEIGAVSYTGVDQAQPYGTTGSKTGSGNPSASITTQYPYDRIIDDLASSASSNPNAPQLQRWNLHPSGIITSCCYGSGSDVNTSSAGTYNIGWAGSSSNWAYVFAEIKPAPASGQDQSTTAATWANVQGSTLTRVCFKVDINNINNATINYTVTDANNNQILSGSLAQNAYGRCGWYCQDLLVPISTNSLVLKWTAFNATNTSKKYFSGSGLAYTYLPQFNQPPYPTGNALTTPNYDLWQGICTLDMGQTLVSISPSFVSPGQNVQVNVTVINDLYQANHIMNLTLYINGNPWSSSDCGISFVNLTSSVDCPSGKTGCIDWSTLPSAVSQNGYFSVTANCNVPSNLGTGSYVLTAFPVTYSSATPLPTGTTTFKASADQLSSFLSNFWDSILHFFHMK